jgi:hypothetical protein
MSNITKKNRNLQSFAADQDLNKGNLIRCRMVEKNAEVLNLWGAPGGPFGSLEGARVVRMRDILILKEIW